MAEDADAIIYSREFPGLAGRDAELLESAEERIRECIVPKKPNSSLSLVGLQLTALPGAALGQCTTIECLMCYRNQLTDIPAELGQCKKLQLLVCSENQLTSLPAELGQCTKLHYVDCAKNQIKSLPAELGRCTKLHYVDCAKNQIKSLPAELGQCDLLWTLDCSNNELTELPAELGKCVKLKHLDVTGNPLEADQSTEPQTPGELRERWTSRPHTKSAARDMS